ncbi:P-loop containing nucleoside triphosphate hydrolase protein [Zopfochytrium polystomum]|nr:P-loop containing nucleoside triphosphate hydrolase protein [Zopfochytrium polystomum]
MTTLWQRARSGAPTAFAAATAAASTPPSRLYAPPAALRPVLLYAAQTRASCCSSPFSAAIATTKASAPSSMLTSHGAIGASRVAHLPPAPRSHRRFSTTSHISAQDLYESLSTGDRLSLAKAITLVESTRHDHKVEAKTLLELLLQDSRRPKTTRRIVHGEKFNTTFRIGLSGAPGVGKSSFIETFGGVARNTNEAILLCEAGGFDIILVETVGVGQSETM